MRVQSSRVQWNRAIILLDESYESNVWPLDKGPRQKKVENWGYTYVAPFWKENKLIQTLKGKKKKS
jgi:hypothetical protein